MRGRLGIGAECGISHLSKDAHENFGSFDINVVVVGDGANMVLNEKRPKIGNNGGWNCVGYKIK